MHRGGRIGGRIRKMAAATECSSNRGVGVPHHSPAKMKKGSSSIKPENPAPSLNCGSARTTIELSGSTGRLSLASWSQHSSTSGHREADNSAAGLKNQLSYLPLFPATAVMSQCPGDRDTEWVSIAPGSNFMTTEAPSHKDTNSSRASATMEAQIAQVREKNLCYSTIFWK